MNVENELYLYYQKFYLASNNYERKVGVIKEEQVIDWV